MVHKMLSIAASILFSFMTLAFVVCLVYTLATPAVQSAIDAVRSTIEGAANDAAASVGIEGGVDLSWLLGDSSSSSDEATAGLTGVSDLVEALATLVGGVTGSTAEADSSSDSSDAADTSEATSSDSSGLPQAYQTWKDAVADPVATVFAGTGVDADVLEGAAGGSSSATAVLTALDETALQRVDANASNYAGTAAAAGISASLPSAARTAMSEAVEAASSFASAARTLVSAVRSVQAGALGASGELVAAADDVVTALRSLDDAVAQAEAALG